MAGLKKKIILLKMPIKLIDQTG